MRLCRVRARVRVRVRVGVRVMVRVRVGGRVKVRVRVRVRSVLLVDVPSNGVVIYTRDAHEMHTRCAPAATQTTGG